MSLARGLRPPRRRSYRFVSVVAWLSSSTQFKFGPSASSRNRWFTTTEARFQPPFTATTGTTALGSSTIMAAAAQATTDSTSNHGKDDTQNNEQTFVSSSSCLKLQYLEETTSTQDEARRWLSENIQRLAATCDSCTESETTSTREECNSSSSTDEYLSSCCLAVMARQQSQGRGTSGRTWLSQRGNLFLTVAIPQSDVPVPLTLLPLQVGVLVANRLDQHLRRRQSRILLESDGVWLEKDGSLTEALTQQPRVTVKWPNDVLINQEKIAGVLIEHHYVPAASSSITNKAASLSYWFLVGIGVNVRHAPSVPTDGPQRGRPSTSLYQHLKAQRHVEDDSQESEVEDDEVQNYDDLARILGQEIAQDLVNWIYEDGGDTKNDYASPQSIQQRKQQRAQQVVDDWKMWAGLSRDISQNSNNQIQYTLRDTGEVVQVVDLEPDGQLRVWHAATRQERVLAADYLY